MDSRLVTAAAGLLLSVAVSALLYWQFGTLLLFVVVPFVPYLALRGRGESGPPARRCPECGFRTRDDAVRYCPRDGTRLE